jgi:hypothetical protein
MTMGASSSDGSPRLPEAASDHGPTFILPDLLYL